MSDPQQPQVPPYASNAGQPPQPGHAAPAAPPAQHYYQGVSAQSYAQPAQQPAQSYSQPAYSSASTTPKDSNTPGRIGFIVGLIGLGLSLLLNVSIQILIQTQSQSYELVNLISGIFSVLIFLAGVGALTFGLIGLKREGAPHGLAGIATGLGLAGVIGTGFNFILNAISSVLYY